jgi:hypothetical protein
MNRSRYAPPEKENHLPNLFDPRTAAVIVAAGLLLIAGFQLALALGAPLGRAAWGGSHDRLPTRLRRSSAVAVVIWVVATAIILARADYLSLPGPSQLVPAGTWVVVVLLGLGAIVNIASSSRWERFGWGPLAAVLAALGLIVATSTV